MKWPFDRPVSDQDTPLYNRFYLNAPASMNPDTAIVWGTEIDADALKRFLLEKSRGADVVVTTAHALVKAMGLALAQFPETNVRVVGRRLHRLRDVDVRMAFMHRRNNEIDLMMISQADTKSLEQIGLEVWQRLLQAGRGEGGRDRDLARLRRVPTFWLRQLLRIYGFVDRRVRLPTFGRLDALRRACATVNDLSFAGAPPMRGFKPTRFPDHSDLLNLTLGPVEPKVVFRGDAPAKVNVMPLFLRVDHRVMDAYRAGQFLAFLRDVLNNPERLNVQRGEDARG